MRHHNRSKNFGVDTPHRVAMMRNMTVALVENGRIETTVTRAKALRSFVEKLVTSLKEPTVANIRSAQRKLPRKETIMTIANEIAPKFKTRPGGYTRVLKLSRPRAGDAADMALIEWVEESLVPAYGSVKKTSKKKAKKKVAKKKVSAKGATKTAKAS